MDRRTTWSFYKLAIFISQRRLQVIRVKQSYPTADSFWANRGVEAPKSLIHFPSLKVFILQTYAFVELYLEGLILKLLAALH
jgi:hypothetical protein